MTTSVGNPPATGAPGTRFTLSHTVQNQGIVDAAASKTIYSLALGTTPAPADIALTGMRSVAKLTPGKISVGSVTLTIPVGTPAGTYHVYERAPMA